MKSSDRALIENYLNTTSDGKKRFDVEEKIIELAQGHMNDEARDAFRVISILGAREQVVSLALNVLGVAQ